VRSFVIDSNKLLKTPENQRPIFEFDEHGIIQLFLKNIVNIIEAVGLKGLRFIPVKKIE